MAALARRLQGPVRDPVPDRVRLPSDRRREMAEGTAQAAHPVDEVEDPFPVDAETLLQILDQLCPAEVDVAKGPTPLALRPRKRGGETGPRP